jgi:hypothetical protein
MQLVGKPFLYCNYCLRLRFGSYQCRCDMELIDCDPEDHYETVLECDNINGLEDTTCTYEQTVGTLYTQEVSEMHQIDHEVEVREN